MSFYSLLRFPKEVQEQKVIILNSRSYKSVFGLWRSFRSSLSMPVALVVMRFRFPERRGSRPLVCGPWSGVCCMRRGRVGGSRLWCRGCKRCRGLGSGLKSWVGCDVVCGRGGIWYRCDWGAGDWSKFGIRIRLDVIRGCSCSRGLRVCSWNACNLGTRG